MIKLAIAIATDHPAFAGHFPSRPVVPGVVLLDESLRAIDRHHGSAGPLAAPLRINAAKFLSMVAPGDPVRLEWESSKASPASNGTTITLRVFAGPPGAERLAMTGVVSLPTIAS